MRFTTALLVTAIATTISACGGSDDAAGPDDNGTGPVATITATVDGVALTAGTVTGAWLDGEFVLGGIFGTGSAARVLNISANNFPAAGTYQLGPGNPSTAIATWVDGTTGAFSSIGTGGSGTLTLTKAALGNIAGTFSFTATTSVGSGPASTVVVTNGHFEVRLQ